MNSMNITLFLILLFLILCMIPFAISLRIKKIDIFEIVLWSTLYYFLIFGLRTIYLFYFGSPFLGNPPFSNDTIYYINIALIYIILSLLFYYLGYYSNIGIAISKIFPSLPKQISKNKSIIFLPCFLLISFIAFILTVNKIGGISKFIFDKQGSITSDGTTYLFFLQNIVIYIYNIFLIIVIKYKKYRLLTFFFLLPLALLVGFISGSKGNFLLPVLTTLITYSYLNKSINYKRILIFIIVAILIFPIFNLYRAHNNFDFFYSLNLYYNPINIIKSFMGRFHDIDSIVYIIRDTPDKMDFQLGRTILPLFISWVPRAIWPDKPTISFGKIFANTYFKNIYGNMGVAASSTIIGEGYLNFHIVGMFLFSLFTGIFQRILYNWLIKNNKNNVYGIFIYANSFLLTFTVWETNVAGFFGRFIFQLFILLLISLITSKK